eukprot:gene7799-7996_t
MADSQSAALREAAARALMAAAEVDADAVWLALADVGSCYQADLGELLGLLHVAWSISDGDDLYCVLSTGTARFTAKSPLPGIAKGMALVVGSASLGTGRAASSLDIIGGSAAPSEAFLVSPRDLKHAAVRTLQPSSNLNSSSIQGSSVSLSAAMAADASGLLGLLPASAIAARSSPMLSVELYSSKRWGADALVASGELLLFPALAALQQQQQHQQQQRAVLEQVQLQVLKRSGGSSNKASKVAPALAGTVDNTSSVLLELAVLAPPSAPVQLLGPVGSGRAEVPPIHTCNASWLSPWCPVLQTSGGQLCQSPSVQCWKVTVHKAQGLQNLHVDPQAAAAAAAVMHRLTSRKAGSSTMKVDRSQGAAVQDGAQAAKGLLHKSGSWFQRRTRPPAATKAVWQQAFWFTTVRPAAAAAALEVELFAAKDDKTRGKSVTSIKVPLHQLVQDLTLTSPKTSGSSNNNSGDSPPVDAFFVLLLGSYCLVSSTSHSSHHHSWGWHVRLPLQQPSDVLTLALFAREDQSGGKKRVGASMLTMFSGSIRLLGKMRVLCSTLSPNVPLNLTMPLQAAVCHLYCHLMVPQLLGSYLRSYVSYSTCSPALYLLLAATVARKGTTTADVSTVEDLEAEVQLTSARWLEGQLPSLPFKALRKVQDDGRSEFTLSRTRSNWRRLIVLREGLAPAAAAFQHLCLWESYRDSCCCYCVILMFGLWPSKVLAVLLLLFAAHLIRTGWQQGGASSLPANPYTALKQNYEGVVQFLTTVQNVLDSWACTGERLQLAFGWVDQLATGVLLVVVVLLAVG